jgi:hypothetical protein
VRFAAYTRDHLPPHVHGFYAGIEVIVDIEDGVVRLSRRKDAIDPRGAKRSDVNHVLTTATRYANEMVELWRKARG